MISSDKSWTPFFCFSFLSDRFQLRAHLLQFTDFIFFSISSHFRLHRLFSCSQTKRICSVVFLSFQSSALSNARPSFYYRLAPEKCTFLVNFLIYCPTLVQCVCLLLIRLHSLYFSFFNFLVDSFILPIASKICVCMCECLLYYCCGCKSRSNSICCCDLCGQCTAGYLSATITSDAVLGSKTLLKCAIFSTNSTGIQQLAFCVSTLFLFCLNSICQQTRKQRQEISCRLQVLVTAIDSLLKCVALISTFTQSLFIV